MVRAIEDMDIQIDTPLDVADQLIEHGLPLNSIDSIVVSHWHFDHVGDPSLFPKSTQLLVGPGFKSHCVPGYPLSGASPIPEAAFSHRAIHEVDFMSSKLKIAGLDAVDHFGDGSLYLLSTPGHAIGHISALARVDVDAAGVSSFLFLAGDVCHHPGELRPSAVVLLPDTSADLVPGVCSSLARSIQPRRKGDEPFYVPAEGVFNANATMMQETIRSVTNFDADPNIMVLIAHDNSLSKVLPLFPHSIDSWKSKGWKDSSRWRFLLDFEYPKKFPLS